MSTEKNAYLDAVLKTHNINLDDKTRAYRIQRDKIKECIDKEFGDSCYGPLNSGSYAKKTAINTKFDLDLAVPFKHKAFGSPGEMYREVNEFMNSLKGDENLNIRAVSEQRRSINVLFNVGGQELDMDIVPGRELHLGQYLDTHNLYLFDSEELPPIITNIKTHIELIKGREKEQQIIKLLKVWKNNKGVDMKSFLVELMVLKAFDKDMTLASKGLYDRLKGSVEFIVNHIEHSRFVDPANSNNIVSDTLAPTEKSLLKEKLVGMVQEIEQQESKLELFFPINEEFRGYVIDTLPKFKPSPFRGGYNSYA